MYESKGVLQGHYAGEFVKNINVGIWIPLLLARYGFGIRAWV